jgi:hypothetical protein
MGEPTGPTGRHPLGNAHVRRARGLRCGGVRAFSSCDAVFLSTLPSMSQDEQARPLDAAPEPISPELALVDPDAARRAREQLGDVDGTAFAPPVYTLDGTDHRARTADGASRTAGGSATQEPSIRERLLAAGADRDVLSNSAAADDESRFHRPYVQDDDGVRRRSRVRPLLATLVGLVCVAAVALASLFLVGRLAERTETGAAGPPSGIGETTARGGSTTARKKTTPSLRRRARRRNTTRTTGQAPKARTTGQAPKARTTGQAPKARTRSAAPDRAPSTRTFVWPPVRAATSYRVEFFRRGRKIFKASPVKPRLELPLRWTYKGRRFRLIAGTYRWRVRPAFGRSSTRLGKAITSSTWIVH